MGKVIKKLAVILAVLIALAGVIVLVLKFTSLGDKVKDVINPEFYIEYDNVRYKGEENTVALPYKGETKLNVKNGGQFKVSVKPNITAETDFNYTVNGQSYPFSGENFTEQFIGEKVYDGSFILTSDGNETLESVLSAIWGGEKVEVPQVKPNCPYLLEVISSKGEVIKIAFSVGLTGITLTPGNIIFEG